MRPAQPVVILLVTLSMITWYMPAAAEQAIGVVKTSAGTATISRGGQILPAAVGTKLLAADTLATGADGSMGVILRDNSTLSIGPETNLIIQEFLFSPAEGKLGLLVRITRGTMAYISGLIGKSAPGSARFETPVATIGIRGTRFAVKVGNPFSDKKVHE
ncbi:MAG TPA: hypothetical protein DEH27_05300 [Deltaproteobacteria bacterium]|nr:hypothetical protein [Deltaproteobacteria bacterium]